MADEHPDDESPWTRDDWVPDSAVPDESPWTRDDWVPDSAVPDAAVFADGARRPAGPGSRTAPPDEPPPEDFEDRDASVRSVSSSLGRKVIAGGIVSALLIASAGALLRDGDDAPTAPGTPGTTVFADPTPTVTSVPRETIPPTTARTVTVPPSPSGAAVEISDPIPSLVAGQPPTWSERQIAVPENLAAIAPTEVITLSQSGILSVTDFPSGRSRSIDVSDVGVDAQLAVGDRAIVAFDSATLVQIRDGEPVVESRLTEGIIFVRPWTGTGNFVVTTPSTGPGAPERDLVLQPDGTLVPLDNPFADETSFFSRVFSPSGEALFSAPGGVYAVGPDGNARRISTGSLLATGARHWAIEECDETLRCAYSIIEWETGTVTAAALESIERFGFIDPSTHISPDGRSIAFRADTDGTGRREILDVATGNTLAAGRINQVVYPDSWATDSSGLFFTDRYLQFVERATGVITQIDDLDRIRTVAVGPFSQAGSPSS